MYIYIYIYGWKSVVVIVNLHLPHSSLNLCVHTTVSEHVLVGRSTDVHTTAVNNISCTATPDPCTFTIGCCYACQNLIGLSCNVISLVKGGSSNLDTYTITIAVMYQRS